MQCFVFVIDYYIIRRLKSIQRGQKEQVRDALHYFITRVIVHDIIYLIDQF